MRRIFATVIAAVMSMVVVASMSSAADDAGAKRRARFEQLLQLMDRNGDRLIDRDELEAFLRAKVGPAIHPEVVHRQAALIIAGQAGKGQGITEDRVEIFENTDFEPPFVGKVRDLLPPPPEAAGSGATASGDTPAPGIVDILRKYISMRRSFLDEEEVARPASLRVTHFGSADDTGKPDRPETVLDVRAAISLTHPILEYDLALGPLTLFGRGLGVLEADVSTDTNAGRDKLVHRVGTEAVVFHTIPTRGWSGHNFSLTFDYTTDRDYRSALIGGTAQYTPNFLDVGIGTPLKLGTFLAMPFKLGWRPYAGVSAADVVDNGDKPELQKLSSYVNGYVRVAADVAIGSQVHLTPEMTWFHEFKGRERTHGLLGVSLRYSLDPKDRFSVELSYTRGRDSPEFVQQDQLAIGFAIKF